MTVGPVAQMQKVARSQTRPDSMGPRAHRSADVRHSVDYVLLVFFVAKLDWQMAFFAGYSIDGITDLFIGRFQKLAVAKGQAVSGPAQG